MKYCLLYIDVDLYLYYHKLKESKKVIENIDYVTCLECPQKSNQRKIISSQHLSIHNMNLTQYKKKYPNVKIVCEILSKRISENSSAQIKAQIKNNIPLAIHTPEAKEQKLRNYYEKYINQYELEYENLTTFEMYKEEKYKFKCKKCNLEFKSYWKQPNCLECKPKVSSNEQEEVYNFIVNELKVENVKQRIRILDGSEIDIYLPDFKLAIEYNGIYWHCELSNGKDSKYHITKTLLANKLGIKLIQIFSDEWLNKKEIVKSRIRNLIGKSKEKIGGRECKIKEITPDQSKEFLNTNHLQGYVRGKVKIGAFYNDELISVMIFGHNRNVTGNKTVDKTEYELLRFATKLNTNIMGIGSRLYQYFITTYTPNNVYSYVNICWSPNPIENFYTKLGLSLSTVTSPNYWYVKNGIREHRWGFRKSELKKRGFDTENKTEWQIMRENGYDRLWDCGSYRYDLKVITQKNKIKTLHDVEIFNELTLICEACKNEFKNLKLRKYCDNCKKSNPEYNKRKGKKTKIFNPIKCNICSKVFKTNLSGAFTIHLKKEHNVKTRSVKEYYTEITQKEFETLYVKKYTFLCKYCKKKQQSNNTTQVYCNNICKNLDPELRKKKGMKVIEFIPLRCKLCNYVCKSNLSGSFKKHLEDVHRIKTENVNKYSFFITLEEYQRERKNRGKYEHICKICKVKFRTNRENSLYHNNICKFKDIEYNKSRGNRKQNEIQ